MIGKTDPPILRTLLGESVRNLRGARFRSIALLLIFIVGFGATTLETYASARSARVEESNLWSSGADVAVLSGSSISGKSCEDLNRVEGVEAAGAMTPDGEVVVTPSDLRTVMAYRVTPGFLEVMVRPGSPTVGGVVADQLLSSQLGIGATSQRTIAPVDSSGDVSGGSTATFIRPIQFSDRGNYYLGSLFFVEPLTSEFTECFVSLAIDAPSNSPTILASNIGGSSLVEGSWLLGRNQGQSSPLVQFDSRAARWAWLVFGFLMVLVSSALIRIRRNEFALYRSCGATFGTLIKIVFPEFLILATLTAAFWPLDFASYQLIVGGSLDAGALTIGLLAGTKFLAVSMSCIPFVLYVSMVGSPWEMLRRDQ